MNSISNFQHTTAEDDALITDYLYQNGGDLPADKIGQIRKIALAEKSLVRQGISPDGKVANIAATVLLDQAQTRAHEIVEAARTALAPVKERYPDYKIMMLGDAPFADATDQVTWDSITRITPIAMTLVLIILVVLLRNLASIIALQLLIGLSIIFAYALFILVDFVFSPISAGASPIILTLAVADGIHILVSYQNQLAQGKNQHEAMIESLRLNFSPIWLTSATTALGFLFMNFAEAPPFHDLGNAVFLGVVMAFLLSVSFLPAMMMLAGPPKTAKTSNQRRSMTRLAEFTIRNKKALIVWNTLIVVGLMACIPMNRVNDILMEYFDHSFEVRRALDFYFENMGGIQRLQFSVPAQGTDGITEPEYLRNLDRLATWAESRPQVSHVRSFSEVIKRLNRNLHNGDKEFYSIPGQRDFISQILLMYELGLPYGLGLDSQVSIDRSATKFEIVLLRAHSDEIVETREAINEWIGSNWPAYMQTRVTGMDSLFADITYENVYSMAAGTTLALIAVSLLMIFSLRSARYGLLSLVPNLFPAGMTFGIWALFSGEVGMVVAVIICMTLGIIIDDTVHLLSKYVRAKRELGMTPEDAAKYAVETVGVALITTSVILVANFGVLGGLSHYYPNNATGIMVSMTIACALVIDLFFFVPLLISIDQVRKDPQPG